jgi:hypothetical protein
MTIIPDTLNYYLELKDEPKAIMYINNVSVCERALQTVCIICLNQRYYKLLNYILSNKLVCVNFNNSELLTHAVKIQDIKLVEILVKYGINTCARKKEAIKMANRLPSVQIFNILDSNKNAVDIYN